MNQEEKQKHIKIFGFQYSIILKQYLPTAFKVWLALALLLLISVLAFNYKMTAADIPGGLFCGALLAYLIHIIKDL